MEFFDMNIDTDLVAKATKGSKSNPVQLKEVVVKGSLNKYFRKLMYVPRDSIGKFELK